MLISRTMVEGEVRWGELATVAVSTELLATAAWHRMAVDKMVGGKVNPSQPMVYQSHRKRHSTNSPIHVFIGAMGARRLKLTKDAKTLGRAQCALQFPCVFLSFFGGAQVLGCSCQALKLRALLKVVLQRAPVDKLKEDQELVPAGGDLRVTGNSWWRSCFQRSNLTRVPRENQIRLIVAHLDRKKKISGSLLDKHDFNVLG